MKNPIPDLSNSLLASQVAEKLNVSSGAVRSWAKAKILRGFQTRSGTWRFLQEDVDAFVCEGGFAQVTDLEASHD